MLKGNTFSAVVQELNKDEIVVIRKMDEAVGNPKSRVIEVLMSNMGNFVTRENLHKLIDHLHESGSFDVQQVFKANTKSIGCAEFIVLENIHEPTVVKF